MTVFSIAYGSCVVCGAPAEGMVNAAAFGHWSEPGRMEPRCRAHGAPPSMTLVSIEEYEALNEQVAHLTMETERRLQLLHQAHDDVARLTNEIAERDTTAAMMERVVAAAEMHCDADRALQLLPRTASRRDRAYAGKQLMIADDKIDAAVDMYRAWKEENADAAHD